MTQRSYDVVVVGSGPNGLAAGIRLLQLGFSVLVLEAAPEPGGGLRSAELTEPGFLSDVCSAVHALLPVSPFLSTLGLAEHGLELIEPPAPMANPLPDGSAVSLYRSVQDTAAELGEDAKRYQLLLGLLVAKHRELFSDLLAPAHLPRHPLLMTRLGMPGMLPAALLSRVAFSGPRARALFAGLAAHSMLPLARPLTSGFGLALTVAAHAAGWPVARGGSRQVAGALLSLFRSLGGQLETGHEVYDIDRVPPARAVILDVTPRQLLRLAGSRFTGGYRRALERFRYGAGVFKVDWSLDGPIPWQAPEVARAGTVHVAGWAEDTIASERAVSRGVTAERPFVLLVQQSLFDSTRAPQGKHVAWAYCHVPNGCQVDMTPRIEAQVERFAPGFRDLVRARSVMSPADMEAHNANYVGGDINGGVQDLRQLYARPALRANPYTTPDPKLFICSSSTPPGGGVHGMSGYYAAEAVAKRLASSPTKVL